MNIPSRARTARLSLWLAGAVAALAAVRAQPAPEKLEPYVVTATRTAQPAAQVGTVTDVLTADELATRQITQLSGIFGLATGAPATPSGATG